MLRNSLKIALRTLRKQKGITAINVLGLAAGMAVCLLVGLLFWDQLTHDAFHPGADRIYRVTTEMQEAGREMAWSPSGLAPVLRDRATSVDAATRLKETRRNVVVDEQGFEAKGLYAEPSFFEVFGFELVAGSEETALADPYTTVLTQKLAQRLFGDADPMGKTVRLADVGPFTVTGIINRDAYRSHLPFDALYSFGTLPSADPPPWEETGHFTYLRLDEGGGPEQLHPTLRQIENQYLPSQSEGISAPKRFNLQAVSDIPLGASLPNDIAEGVLPATEAYLLGGLALLVLLAAGFNYVNLSMARSLTRSREVGVRKTMGAHRGQVMGQFLVEGIVVAMLALGLAVLFLKGLVPAYNQLSIVQRQLNAPIETEPGAVLYGLFGLFALLVGVVAGLFPAWHLSSFQPARVLRTSGQGTTPGFEWLTPRKVLIVFQFAVALVVIVTAVLFSRQASHMGNLEGRGLQTDGLVRVELQEVSYELFQQEAQRRPAIERVGAANSVPLDGEHPLGSVQSGALDPLGPSTYYAADYEFIEALGVSLVATENWTEARFESGQVVLISEGAARQFGFETPQEALGYSFTIQDETTSHSVQIAGVARDFHFSFHFEPSEPLIFHYNPSQFTVALAEALPGQEEEARSSLKAVWSHVDTADPFEAQVYQNLIRREQVAPIRDIGGILVFVAGLAVLISCLGLLGIATYTVQTRVREVGIRKALGATVGRLVARLSKDFLWLVGVAIGFGLPVAWGLNRLWLQNFAHRIELSVWPFVLSAAGLLGLALLAIGSQTVRAALTDPAQTLRDE